VDDAVGPVYRVGPPDVSRDQVVQGLAGERCAVGRERRGVDARGEDVEEEQRLEGAQVAQLQQEAPELRVQVPLQRLVPLVLDLRIRMRRGRGGGDRSREESGRRGETLVEARGEREVWYGLEVLVHYVAL
jgi:hypothetical protein